MGMHSLGHPVLRVSLDISNYCLNKRSEKQATNNDAEIDDYHYYYEEKG